MLEPDPRKPEILKYIKAELNRPDRIIIDIANNADQLIRWILWSQSS
jgi:hypothetical protein